MYPRRLLGLGLTFLVAVAASVGAAGCAAPADEASESGGAVTAKEANDASFALRNHVLIDFPASPANAKALGVTKWDLFTSADPTDKFQGSVFYASNAENDVTYVFVVDLNNRRVASI